MSDLNSDYLRLSDDPDHVHQWEPWRDHGAGPFRTCICGAMDSPPDPDTGDFDSGLALADLRKLMWDADSDRVVDVSMHVERVTELFLNLDFWLTSGGELPAAWRERL